MNSDNASASTVILAALGGAILGAGIALLYAPESGRRTREKLKGLGGEAGDWLQKGHDFVEDKKRQVMGAVEGAIDGAKDSR